MRNALAQALPTLVVFSLAACGSSSSAGSCAFTEASPGDTSCEDFVGSGYTTSAVQSDCSRGGGIYSASACPTAGALGTCDVLAGMPAEGKTTYYATDGGTSTTADQESCTSEGGTWTPG